MLLTLPDVLNADTLNGLRQFLATAQWEDGSKTAGAGSRSRKHNLQVNPSDPNLAQWREVITGALMRHPVTQFLILPKRIMTPVFNRYDQGMQYQDHVDFPLLDKEPRMRADLSVTLFLSPPESYQGGELVIGTPDGEQRVKLQAGQAIVYPSSTLHRVETVRSGSRLAAVTTIQSHVRGETERNINADMVRLWRMVEDMAPDGPEVRLAAKIHHNLLRLWAE